MLEKDFVPYKEALLLKELGFNEVCCGSYTNTHKQLYPYSPINKWFKNSDLLEECYSHIDSISAPLYQQVFRWFREKYSLFFPILENDKIFIEKGGKKYIFFWEIDKSNGFEGSDLYEKAELLCLNKLIEILKNNEI